MSDGVYQAVCQRLETGIGSYLLSDLVTRVHYGGVVTLAESYTDISKRSVGEHAGEIHGDLSGESDGAGPFAADEGLG